MLKLALRGEEIKVGDVIFQFISGFSNSETVQTVETRMCLKQQRIRYVFSKFEHRVGYFQIYYSGKMCVIVIINIKLNETTAS